MAHDLSLSYSRFDHMSPTGVALAMLLHAAVALALWWVSPLRHIDLTPDPVEITMEREVTPPPQPQPQPPPPPPPPVQAAPPPQPAPPVPKPPPPQLGLQAPIGTTMDPRASLSQRQADPTMPQTPGQQASKPEPSTAANPEPPKEIVKPDSAKEEPKAESSKEEQQAALAPQPPAPLPQPQAAPTLEKALPPVEAPPPPLTSREIPRPVAPPPPPPAPPKPQPQPAPHAQTPPPQAARPPAPQQQLPSSPLSHLPQQHAPAESQQASRQAPSAFVNPADAYGQRKAQEDYLWSVIRKISQLRYYPKGARENNEYGTVITLVTIGRDGRLIDATISRSSGYHNLDQGVLEIIREAAPYPPLPNNLTGDRHTFVLPLNYKRNDSQ